MALMLCCMVVLVVAFLDKRKKGEREIERMKENAKTMIEQRKKLDEKWNSVDKISIDTEFKDVKKNGGE